MDFAQKLDELQKQLDKLGLKVTKGIAGLFVEDVKTGSFCLIDGEVTSENIKNVALQNIKTYEIG